MPLFYFDVEGDVLNGREPQEFADVRAAQGEALKAAGEIIRDEDGKLIGKTWTMNVTDEAPSDDLVFDEALHSLAHRIARHAAGRRSGEPRAPMFRGGLPPATFRKMEAMIDAALDEARTPLLAEMAALAGMSVTHFLRAFRRHTGRTPHKYLMGRRMDRAVSLLRDRMAVGDVAEQVGFATPALFVASFRSAMGVTPGAVREALAG